MNTVSVSQASSFLDRLKGQVALALPSHMNPDRMCRLALTEFSKNEKLQLCTMESIAACVMTSSQLGLEIGVNGQAYMIPYGDTATFVPGWKGLIDLVNRAGRASAWTGAVFEGDFFEWQLGDSPQCTHRPEGESDPNKMLFAYAVGRPKGAEYPVIEVWNQKRLKAHFNKYNKVGKRHYAHDNWEMYCRKVVLLQVLKYLPQSVELTEAVQKSHAAEKMPEVVDSFVATNELSSITSQIKADSEKVSPSEELIKNLLSEIENESVAENLGIYLERAEIELGKMEISPQKRTAMLKKVNAASKARFDALTKE